MPGALNIDSGFVVLETVRQLPVEVVAAHKSTAVARAAPINR